MASSHNNLFSFPVPFRVIRVAVYRRQPVVHQTNFNNEYQERKKCLLREARGIRKRRKIEVNVSIS